MFLGIFLETRSRCSLGLWSSLSELPPQQFMVDSLHPKKPSHKWK